MSPERPPKVFISYSHDSPEHEDRVLDLAERLVEKDGIDVSLDRFVNPPPASWPKWMNAEMKAADFIFVVCSATYLAKVESKVKPGKARESNGKACSPTSRFMTMIRIAPDSFLFYWKAGNMSTSLIRCGAAAITGQKMMPNMKS